MFRAPRLIILALVGGGASAAAQDVPRLSLDEAIEIANRRNPSTLAAEAQADVAGLDVRAQYGSFLPTVNANLDWSAGSNTTLTGTDDFGRTVKLSDPVTYRRSSASQGFSGSVRLFDGFRNVNQLRAAQRSLSAAYAGVDLQRLQVEADVTTRFYDALRAERLVAVEEQLLASARERLDANERLFRVAAASQVDVLGAQVDVSRGEQSLELQRGEARKARLRVLETLGVLDEMVDFVPEGAFPAVFDPSGLDIDQLVAAGLQANPAVVQRGWELSSAEASAKAALGNWLPTVDLSGGWSRGLNEQSYSAFFDLNPGQDRGYRFSLSLSWPIFNGFQRSSQIGQANAQRRRADENLRQATLQIEQEIRAAVIDVQNRYEALETQRRSTELSRTRVTLAREQYLTAAISFTNLQQIIESASGQERALVDAEYNYAVAVVNLEARVGEPVRPQ